MKNTAEDLRNILFAQLERLDDPEEGAVLSDEIARAKAIAATAKVIVDLAKEETARAKLSGRGDAAPGTFFNQKQIN